MLITGGAVAVITVLAANTAYIFLGIKLNLFFVL